MKFINFLNKAKFFILFLVIGLVFFIHPMLSSNFDLIMGDKVSTLYNNYVLEHSFLWLNQIEPHNSFWSAPFGVQENVLANKDTLMGILPIYWIIRSILQNPFSSFQILFIILCILNYSTFYYFLNKQLKFSSLASSFASFFFAFNILRYFRSFDIGYFSQFLTIFALIFLFKVSTENKRMINHIYFLFFATFLILQFYTCFSLGFFASFVGFFAGLLSFIPKSSRDKIVKYLENFWQFLLFYLFIVAILLLPMAYHFALLENIKSLSQFTSSIYAVLIWFKNVSLLDSFIVCKMPFIGYLNYLDTSCSVGILALILSIFGIWKASKYRGAIILTILFIYLTSCNEIAQDIWKILYFLIPGTEGLDNVNQIIFVGLIFFAIGCAYLVQFFENNVIKNKIITNILLVASVLVITTEQFPMNKDVNSPWESYTLSKKEFQNEISLITQKIKKDTTVLNLEYKGINKNKFGAQDIKNKEKIAQKYISLLSMYSALKLNIYSQNSYFSKPNETKKAQTIEHIVDFSKI